MEIAIMCSVVLSDAMVVEAARLIISNLKRVMSDELVQSFFWLHGQDVWF